MAAVENEVAEPRREANPTPNLSRLGLIDVTCCSHCPILTLVIPASRPRSTGRHATLLSSPPPHHTPLPLPTRHRPSLLRSRCHKAKEKAKTSQRIFQQSLCLQPIPHAALPRSEAEAEEDYLGEAFSGQDEQLQFRCAVLEQ